MGAKATTEIDADDFFTEDITVKDEATQEEAADDTPAEPAGEDDPDSDSKSEDGEFDAEKAQEKIRKVNSENRNLRKRLREAEAATAGGEDLQAQITGLRQQVAAAQKREIAVEVGLPASWADRLVGGDVDEWRDDAESLAAELKAARGSVRPTVNPGASNARKSVPELSEADAFFMGQ